MKLHTPEFGSVILSHTKIFTARFQRTVLADEKGVTVESDCFMLYPTLFFK